MKKIFSKILIMALVAVYGGVLTGCNPEQEMKPFKVDFKEAGPGYVALMAQVPYATKVYYAIRNTPAPMLTAELLAKSAEVERTYDYFYADGVHRLSGGGVDIEENGHYYMYLVAKLKDGLSDLYSWEFETGEFQFDQLATILGVLPDGYVVHLKMPESVKPLSAGADSTGSTAIRYAHANVMMYNTQRQRMDETEFLLYNGGVSVREDKTIEFSDRTNIGNVGYDADGDGEITDADKGALWDYIAPGEPIVFIAGEYKFMKEPWFGLTGTERDEALKNFQQQNNLDPEDDNYFVDGFYYPAAWKPGYYLPCVDPDRYWALYAPPAEDDTQDSDPDGTDAGSAPAVRNVGLINDFDFSSSVDDTWTGQFQRKIFLTRQPAKLNKKVSIKATNIRSVDATVTIRPEKGIYRYVYLILDDATYNELIDNYLSGHDEYLQWAISSYFGMMNFGASAVEPDPLLDPNTAATAKLNLSNYFYDVPSDTKYHVLVTAMGGEEVSAPQSFTHYTFRTPPKTKENGPTIEVTVLDEDHPEGTDAFNAAFNIRCTSVADNPVVKCYYGANYYKDWILSINGQSSSYETLGQSATFTESEIAQINSPAGLNIRIPSIDGEKTRLVVVGYNDENISNGLDKVKKENILNHPSVADCVTPYAELKTEIQQQATAYFRDKILDGDWTMTADVINKGKRETMSTKVTFKTEFKQGDDADSDFPTALPADVKALYQEVTDWTETEIEGHFDNFVSLADIYKRKRLRGQNKILLAGWLQQDTLGYAAYKSPWDMFISKDISTVDVESLYSEFGPKAFIEVYKDKHGADSLALTSDYYFASPAVNYSQTPFYLAAAHYIEATDTERASTEVSFYHSNYAPLEFPVELSEDKNTLTIKGIVYEKEESGKTETWYPSLCGVDAMTGRYVLDKPIVSDVVLTRGWTEPVVPETPAEPAVRSLRRSGSVAPVRALQEFPRFVYKDKTKFGKAESVVEMEGKILTVEEMHRNVDKYWERYIRAIRK